MADAIEKSTNKLCAKTRATLGRENGAPMKKKLKISLKSGRTINRPKKYLTTSSEDDGPRAGKHFVKVNTGIKKLNVLAENLLKSDNLVQQKFGEKSIFHSSGELLSQNNIAASSEPHARKDNDNKNREDHGPATSQTVFQSQPVPAEENLLIDENVRFSSQILIKSRNDTHSKQHKQPKQKESRKVEWPLNVTPESKKQVEINHKQAVDQREHPRMQKVAKKRSEQLRLNQDVTLEDIADCLNVILSQNSYIMDKLRKIDEKSDPPTAPLYQSLKGFPLQSIEQFQEFEENLQKQRELFKFLCNVGGTKPREALSYYLKESMADQLVSKYTWSGKNQTENFGTSMMASVYLAALKKSLENQGHITRNEFKAHMSEVIRAAKQRDRISKVQKDKPKNARKDEMEQFQFERDELTNFIKDQANHLRSPSPKNVLRAAATQNQDRENELLEESKEEEVEEEEVEEEEDEELEAEESDEEEDEEGDE